MWSMSHLRSNVILVCRSEVSPTALNKMLGQLHVTSQWSCWNYLLFVFYLFLPTKERSGRITQLNIVLPMTGHKNNDYFIILHENDHYSKKKSIIFFHQDFLSRLTKLLKGWVAWKMYYKHVFYSSSFYCNPSMWLTALL